LVGKDAEPVAESVPLLDALPELAAAGAGPELRVEAEWVPAGPFRPDRIAGGRGAVVLLLSGLVARTMALEDGSAAELLGPGALLSPPGSGGQEELGLPDYHVRFEALETSRVGVVGPELLAGLAGRPELVAALLAGRGRHDAERGAMHVICRLTGVDRRLLALFRLLAARQGRPTPDGVAVPVAIPHRLLAELVGARRPTVTTALRALRHSGELRRLDDGTWLLRTAPTSSRRNPGAPAGRANGASTEDTDGVPATSGVAPLAARVGR
jgi:CRP/FNR family transcriptional regulator, cyclic AMP receptor protein